MNKHIYGGLLITGAMFLFSLAGPFVRFMDPEPIAILFYTNFFAALVLLGYFLYTKQYRELLFRKFLGLMLLSGGLVTGNTLTFYLAYDNTTLSNAVLTHYTAPIFAALLAPAVLGEKLEKTTLVSLALSMTGLVCIAMEGIAISSAHLAGILYGTLSGVFYGLLILVSKKLTHHFNTPVILLYQCTVISVLLAPFVATHPVPTSLNTYLLLFTFGVMVSIYAVLLYLKGLRLIKGQHAGILAYSEPFIVVLLGVVLYREIPSLFSLFGGALIIYSGVLVVRSEIRTNGQG